MTSLYQLSADYRQLEQLTESDLSDDQFLALIDEADQAIRDKSINVAKFIANLVETAESIKRAEQRMADRRKVLENRAERMREYLLQAMIATDTLSIECPEFRLSVQDNPPSVQITGEVPAEYMVQPAPPPARPDKRRMLDDMKQGVCIEGAELVRGKRLVIR